jgi:hypothetical protein
VYYILEVNLGVVGQRIMERLSAGVAGQVLDEVDVAQ